MNLILRWDTQQLKVYSASETLTDVPRVPKWAVNTGKVSMQKKLCRPSESTTTTETPSKICPGQEEQVYLRIK